MRKRQTLVPGTYVQPGPEPRWAPWGGLATLAPTAHLICFRPHRLGSGCCWPRPCCQVYHRPFADQSSSFLLLLTVFNLGKSHWQIHELRGSARVPRIVDMLPNGMSVFPPYSLGLPNKKSFPSQQLVGYIIVWIEPNYYESFLIKVIIKGILKLGSN